jgi:hypothetical protein
LLPVTEKHPKTQKKNLEKFDIETFVDIFGKGFRHGLFAIYKNNLMPFLNSPCDTEKHPKTY